VSLIKSHNNDRIIFMREKLYPKFKDKNIVVTFCQALCTQARLLGTPIRTPSIRINDRIVSKSYYRNEISQLNFTFY